MASSKRWRVGYFDRVKRVERTDDVDASGEPDRIIQRLQQLHPDRRYRWIRQAEEKASDWLG